MIAQGLTCPECGSKEMHPDGDKLLIRGFKVQSEDHWWSQCLFCAGYYDKALVYNAEAGDPKKGWF